MSDNYINIVEYINREFGESYEDQSILIQLTQVDNELLSTLFEMLESGKIQKGDLTSITINNDTVQALIDKVNSVEDSTFYIRKYYIDILYNSYNFIELRREEFRDIAIDILKKNSSLDKYMYRPKVDLLNPTNTQKYYIESTRYYKERMKVDSLLINEVAKLKAHKRYEYFTFLDDLLDECFNKPLFIKSVFSKADLNVYQDFFKFILNKEYLSADKVIFNKCMDYTINQMVLNHDDSELQNGWDVILDITQSKKWTELKEATVYNTSEKFYELKVYKIFLGNLYSREYPTSVLENEIVVYLDFIEFFDILYSVFKSFSRIAIYSSDNL